MNHMMYAIVDWLSSGLPALMLIWLFLVLCRRGGNKRVFWISLFTLYLCEVFHLVGIPAISYIRWDPNINWIPFGDEKNLRFFFQVGMNAVLFMPFGFMLPILWKNCRAWKTTLLAGIVTSLMIEGLQLFSFRATDVDDLLMNTFGTALGYILARVCFHKKWENDDRKNTAGVSEWIDLAVSIGIPLLVILFLQMPISNWIYSLPMFE